MRGHQWKYTCQLRFHHNSSGLPCQPLPWYSSPPCPPSGPQSFARRAIVGTDHRVEARHQNQCAVYLTILCVTKIKMSEKKRFQLNQEILKHWSSEALCTWTCIAFIKETISWKNAFFLTTCTTFLRRWNSRFERKSRTKHCQRHNGPEGWVQLTKVTCLSHITSSRKNLDQDYLQNLHQASTSKFQPNISISSKLKTSKSWPNLASESRPRINFITCKNISGKVLTKLQLQNLAWTSTSKSWPNLVLKVWTKVYLYDQTSAPKSATNCY